MLLCLRIDPSVLLRKYPLPVPVGGGVGIFAVKSRWKLNAAPATRHVPLMDRLDLLEMIRKHCDAVFRAFATADEDLVAGSAISAGWRR